MRSCSAPRWAATSRCASTTICTTCRCRGRLAVDYLAKHVPGIRDLPYFHHMQTQLFGFPVMISRTGYTGERGYEIFCRGQDAGTIWDTHPRRGQERWASSRAASPRSTCCASRATCCSTPTTIRRNIRSTNEGPGDTLWELGLDFTVSPGKTGFRGAEEHYRLKGKERFKIFGVLLDGKEPADEGAPVYRDGKKVGVVTCAMYSPLVKKSMGIARLDVDCAVQGTKLEIRNKSGVDQGDGAAAALRRPEEDQAQREGLRHNSTDGSRRASSAGRSTEPCRRSRAGIISSSRTRKVRWRSSTWPPRRADGFFADAHIIFIPGRDGDACRGARGAEAGAVLPGPFLRQRAAAPEADAGQRAYGPARSISPAPKG